MTQSRRVCQACLNALAEPGAPFCADCGIAHPANRSAPTAKPRVDLSQGLPEDLSGYSVEDFLP